MLFDQTSLLAAIGFSSAALSVTLCLAWVSARQDSFLRSWSIGMATIVVGVVLYSAIGRDYRADVHFLSFAMLTGGFAFIYAGGMQYRTGSAAWYKVVLAAAAGLLPTGLAYALGYSGLGASFANIGIALLVALTAYEYWLGRHEAQVQMMATATLYALTAISFLLCGVELVRAGQFVLLSRPVNLAEDVNAVVVIIGVTGIGALSLAMNQTRIARKNRADAITDALTGLVNRRALIERFEQAPAEPSTCLMMLDLDHFKKINDQFGHDAGDLVLCRFADIVRNNIRGSDIAARMGGEEFCIVLPSTSAAAAAEIAERIRAELELETFEVSRGTAAATVSVGLVMCTGDAEPFGTLLSRADIALYKAKQSGRNKVHTIGMKLVA